MKNLFLDLASGNGLLACVTPEAVVASRAVDHRIRDDELIPLIEDILREAGWSFPDLTHIACVTGPGGFTSLRVAVTCASVLADQLAIPLAGIHLSRLSQERLTNSPAHELTIWLHSTKKTQLFVCGADWKEPTLVTLEELLQKLPSGTSWYGELIEEHRKAVTDAGLAEASLKPIEEILPSFLHSLSYEKKPLEPWYGRGW